MRRHHFWERTRPVTPAVGQGPIFLTHYYQSAGRHEDAKAVVAEIRALHPNATAERGFDYLARRIRADLLPPDLIDNLKAAGLP